MSSLMAIDPAAAKPHVTAYWIDGALSSITFGLPPWVADRVVCEDQWGSLTSVKLVTRFAGHLLGRLDVDPGQVLWAPPSTWKRQLCGGRAPKTRWLDIYQVHQAILARLTAEEQVTYLSTIGDLSRVDRAFDVADAVGIGLWAAAYHSSVSLTSSASSAYVERRRGGPTATGPTALRPTGGIPSVRWGVTRERR